MPKLRKLTANSYLCTSTNGERYGVLVDNTDRYYSDSEKSPYTLYTSTGIKQYNNIEDLKELDGLKVKIDEPPHDEIQHTVSELGDYPVNSTDTIHEVQEDSEIGIPTFKKSTRTSIRYYPGWFIIKTADGKYTPKLTISTKSYAERAEKSEVQGPYKNYMLMNAELKELQKK